MLLLHSNSTYFAKSVLLTLAGQCAAMGNPVYWPVFFLIENWVFAHEQCLVLKYPILIRCLVLFFLISHFSFLLSPLIRLRRLESALTRHNQSELCFCSRLLADFSFLISPHPFPSSSSICFRISSVVRSILVKVYMPMHPPVRNPIPPLINTI